MTPANSRHIDVYRRGARVIVIAPDQRVLMIRGHDSDDHNHSWWFTPGGGLEPGESPRSAAVRELREETGCIIPLHELVGPVLLRRTLFRFTAQTWIQDEQFFVWRPRHLPAITHHAWTENEKSVLDEMRWFSAAELQEHMAQNSHRQMIYPEGFAELFPHLLSGWDGHCRRINVAGDGDFTGAHIPPWEGDGAGAAESL